MDYSVLTRIAKGWKIIVACGLAGLVAAIVVHVSGSQRFTSSVQFYVSAQDVISPQQIYEAGQLSQARVVSYVDVLNGPRLAAALPEPWNTRYRQAELQSMIQAAAGLDSVLIDVSVTGHSAEEAQQLALSVANVAPPILSDLDALEPGQRPASVVVRPVSEPILPEEPDGPSLKTVMAAGLLAGLLVGVAGMYIRSKNDRWIRSESDLTRASNIATLAVVPRVEKMVGISSFSEALMSPIFTEAYKQLRASLRLTGLSHSQKAIACISTRAEQGRTLSVVGLASAQSASGDRVLVVDADIKGTGASSVAALEPKQGLLQILDGVPWTNLVQRASVGNFDVLPLGAGSKFEAIFSASFRKAFEEMKITYDSIVFDTPDSDSHSIAMYIATIVDQTVIVGREQSSTVDDFVDLEKTVTLLGSKVAGTVLVDAISNSSGSYSSYYTSKVGAGES